MKTIKTLSMTLGMSLGITLGASQVNAADQVRMGTIAPGTSAYQVMTTMASMVNRANVGVEVKVDATGSAAKHQVDMAQGKLDVAMTAPELYGFMVDGTKMYSKMKSAPELSKNVGLIYWFPYGAFHYVTYADSGIKTLKDLKGKKVFLGPPGGGAWVTANAWVESTTGLKQGKDYENVRASWASALQGFQDRQFDVYVTGGIPPFPQVEQLALTSKLRLLGLNTEQAMEADEAMLKPVKALGRFMDVINEGTYDNVETDGDIHTIGATVGVVARMDLSEDTVYRMTKAFWENLEEEAKTAPYLKRVNIKRAFSAQNMKLHPGALKYYREIGLAVSAAMQ
ncbi:MAG: TAXI family TRAP transporter solute-binding subunit [Oceanobacter sp.]